MAQNGNGSVDDEAYSTAVPGILAMADCYEPFCENQRLIDVATECAAAIGADTTILDLRDLELPAYRTEVAASDIPQGVHAFRQLLCAHDGFLFAFPSASGVQPPLLFNAIAWSLCPALGPQAPAAFTGKCASFMSATGNSSVLEQLLAGARAHLTNLGVLVLPDALVIPARVSASEVDIADEDDTRLKVERQIQMFVDTIRWAQSLSESEI